MALIRRYPLWIIGAVGLAVRLYLAFHWYGNGDLFTFEIVAVRTEQGPLHSYAGNVGEGAVLYPYPPGYLPWLMAALELAQGTGLAFHGVVQLLPIVADVLIAIAVNIYLGWRGAGQAQRVVGFALVMLGPVFIAISGYHGQLDSVAILTGVLALMVWERGRQSSRALASGFLIGVGILLKTVPGLLLVPFVGSARSLGEAAKLIGVALGVAALGCLPFWLAEPDGFGEVLAWSGVPGRGGLSVLADPGFAADRRLSVALALSGEPNAFANAISRASGVISFLVLIAVGAFVFRYRPTPVQGAVVLWLAIFVFSPNFLLHYMIWALPFFIMAGYLRETALLQVAVVPVLLITYMDFDAMTRFLANAYVAMMIGLWMFWVVALVVVVLRTVRGVGPPIGPARDPWVAPEPVVTGR